jgi:bla regulator protein blaR1
MTYADLGNHLWQSTLFALVMAALTLVLRHNRAEVRYALWLAASLKFLLPFSLLTFAGSLLEWRQPAPAAVPITQTVEQFSRPFEQAQIVMELPGVAPRETLALVPLALWAAGFALTAGLWILGWWRIHRVARTAVPCGLSAPIPVLTTQALMEPGVFGLFRPVLLLPEGITERLTPAQLDAIIAHELCHVARRDNLAAALHMLVASLFWFHPLVWWIGRKLVDERERACDEAVIRQGNQPQVYAESILGVCKFYLESPLPCTAGITGSDLKKRIETIMTQRISHTLTLTRKLLLSATALTAVAVPFLTGMLQAQAAQSEKTFDVVSVKPSAAEMHQVRFMLSPGGGLNISGMNLKQLMAIAYDVREFQISGGPGWIESDRFDIMAKGPSGDQREFPNLSEAERQQMRDDMNARIRHMLAERFGLQLHKEQKETSVLALVQLPSGHKLKPVDVSGGGVRQHVRMGRGLFEAEAATLDMLTTSLSRSLGKPVLDRTGLKGGFVLKLAWTPDGSELTGRSLPGGPPPPADGGPSLFTAVQEQLGLKLESTKAPVDTLVIDKVEKPSAN